MLIQTAQRPKATPRAASSGLTSLIAGAWSRRDADADDGFQVPSPCARPYVARQSGWSPRSAVPRAPMVGFARFRFVSFLLVSASYRSARAATTCPGWTRLPNPTPTTRAHTAETGGPTSTRRVRAPRASATAS
ncbi:unnamed protein product [Urochloa humidicola]